MILPTPLTLESTTAKSATAQSASSNGKQSNSGSSSTENPKPQPPQVLIPGQDLKPLYDFALDCRSCQAKLSASQGDLADEKAKTAVLTKERDAALKVAKGGSMLRRVARAAKWIAIGAAAGALAAKTVR